MKCRWGPGPGKSQTSALGTQEHWCQAWTTGLPSSIFSDSGHPLLWFPPLGQDPAAPPDSMQPSMKAWLAEAFLSSKQVGTESSPKHALVGEGKASEIWLYILCEPQGQYK